MKNTSRKTQRPDRGGWLPGAGAAGAYRPWLEEPGSLTAHIIAACPRHAPFSVRVLARGDARPEIDEREILGIGGGRAARVREVLLLSGATPVVFAHTAVMRRHLRHPWQLMERVGGRALGGVLFTDPRIVRGALYFRRLDSRHPLYYRAAAWSPTPVSQLWARRAAFRRGDCPLLVTEVFLPAILNLKP